MGRWKDTCLVWEAPSHTLLSCSESKEGSKLSNSIDHVMLPSQSRDVTSWQWFQLPSLSNMVDGVTSHLRPNKPFFLYVASFYFIIVQEGTIYPRDGLLGNHEYFFFHQLKIDLYQLLGEKYRYIQIRTKTGHERSKIGPINSWDLLCGPSKMPSSSFIPSSKARGLCHLFSFLWSTIVSKNLLTLVSRQRKLGFKNPLFGTPSN